MNKERLKQILQEKAERPDLYYADGGKYFDEAIPVLIRLLEDKPEVKPSIPVARKVETKPMRRYVYKARKVSK